MSSPTFISGPWAALYIQETGSTDPMVLVPLETTGPYTFTETIEKSWVQATGKYEQSGAKIVNLNLSFISLDDLAIKIARGLALNAPTVYGTPTNTQYMLLLVDGADLSTNLYLPCVESIGPFSFGRSKSEQTAVNLVMSYQDPDLNTLLWAQGDFTELQTVIDPQNWPF